MCWLSASASQTTIHPMCRCFRMPPLPISASKAASLWLRSVEAGRPPNEMNRTARIAYAVPLVEAKIIHTYMQWTNSCDLALPRLPKTASGKREGLIPLLDFLLRGVPAQRAPSALSLQWDWDRAVFSRSDNVFHCCLAFLITFLIIVLRLLKGALLTQYLVNFRHCWQPTCCTVQSATFLHWLRSCFF